MIHEQLDGLQASICCRVSWSYILAAASNDRSRKKDALLLFCPWLCEEPVRTCIGEPKSTKSRSKKA